MYKPVKLPKKNSIAKQTQTKTADLLQHSKNLNITKKAYATILKTSDIQTTLTGILKMRITPSFINAMPLQPEIKDFLIYICKQNQAEPPTVEQCILLSQSVKALDGDTKAFKALVDIANAQQAIKDLETIEATEPDNAVDSVQSLVLKYLEYKEPKEPQDA